MEGFTEIKNKKIAQNALLLPSYFLLILIIILMVTLLHCLLCKTR